METPPKADSRKGQKSKRRNSGIVEILNFWVNNNHIIISVRFEYSTFEGSFWNSSAIFSWLQFNELVFYVGRFFVGGDNGDH